MCISDAFLGIYSVYAPMILRPLNLRAIFPNMFLDARHCIGWTKYSRNWKIQSKKVLKDRGWETQKWKEERKDKKNGE